MYKEISFVDLHVHSKYSIACSKNADIHGYCELAKLKGIDYIGTGDIFAEDYFNYIKKNLKQIDIGTYIYNGIKFFLSVELSFIYREYDKTKKVHLITVFSDLNNVLKIRNILKDYGKLNNNGRPIIKMNLHNYIDIIKNIDEYSIIIPAHIWTPHFGIMGQKSGYDSIKQAIDLKYVSAIETGLSSDPDMNRYIDELLNIPIVSFSDAHSPEKLGREITMFKTKNMNIRILKNMIEENNIYGTVEFYPEEGKYFARGHRKCNYSTLNKSIINCPVCNKPLTEGVFTRIKTLSKRQLKKYDKNVFYSFPVEIIAEYIKKNMKVKDTKKSIIEKINKKMPEMYFKTFAKPIEIERITGYHIGEFVEKMRNKKINMQHGYDGLYGKLIIQEE